MSQSVSTDIFQDSSVAGKSYKERCRQIAKAQCTKILDQKQAQHDSEMKKLRLEMKNLVINSENKDKKIRELEGKIDQLQKNFTYRLEQSMSIEGLKNLGMSVIQSSQMDHQGYINNLQRENQRIKQQVRQLRSRLEEYTKKEYSAVSIQQAIDSVAQEASSKSLLTRIQKQGPFRAYFFKKNKMIDFFTKISSEEIQLEIKTRASVIQSIYIQKNN